MDDLFQDVCLSELDDLFDIEDVDDIDGDNDLGEYSESDSSSPDEFDVYDAESDEMDMSFSAPPFSPIVPHDDQQEFLDNTSEDVNGPDHNSDVPHVPLSPMLHPTVPHDDQGVFLDNIDWDVIGDEDVNGTDHNTIVRQGSSDWKGFKIVGDNVDKNIRPSLQRFNNKTNSLHYFHYYVCFVGSAGPVSMF